MQGKAVLKTQEKFYLADSSLKYCVTGFNPKSIAAIKADPDASCASWGIRFAAGMEREVPDQEQEALTG